MDYYNLLKDPRWLRKRKKILKRDGYNKSGKNKKPKQKIKPEKKLSLRELYKIWEPKLKGRKYRLTKYK